MRTKYNIIYVDPPWTYSNKQGGDPARGGITYPTMSIKELLELPVWKLAADDCMLFMWATMPLLPEAFPIMKAWRFKYRTMAFDWLKLNPTGWTERNGRDIILHNGVYSGMGSYVCQNNELCLLGKRGKLQRVRKDIKLPIIAPRGRHSAKPAEARHRIEHLYGDVPRIELFAREAVPGWDSIGNGLDGRDIKDVLAEWDNDGETNDQGSQRRDSQNQRNDVSSTKQEDENQLWAAHIQYNTDGYTQSKTDRDEEQTRKDYT